MEHNINSLMDEQFKFLSEIQAKHNSDLIKRHMNDLSLIQLQLDKLYDLFKAECNTNHNVLDKLQVYKQKYGDRLKELKTYGSNIVNIKEEIQSVIDQIEVKDSKHKTNISVKSKLHNEYEVDYKICYAIYQLINYCVFEIQKSKELLIVLDRNDDEEIKKILIRLICKRDNNSELEKASFFRETSGIELIYEKNLLFTKLIIESLDGKFIINTQDDQTTLFDIILPLNDNVKPNEIKCNILHLSDLHIDIKTEPIAILEPLLADLKDIKEGPGVENIDILIISGDIVHSASPKEYKNATEFIVKLKKLYDINTDKCIIVPGNHDVDWNVEVYSWKSKRIVEINKLEEGSYFENGTGVLIRKSEQIYRKRFDSFSKNLYRPVIGINYPLNCENQCTPYLFVEHRILILAMNSCWQIDEHYYNRSGINSIALTKGLLMSEEMIGNAKKTGELPEDSPIVKIAVFHHPVTGDEKMCNDAFMERLQKADFNLCLHGHIHEDKADVFRPIHPTRKINITGAGTFESHDRRESKPRLYNILEVYPNKKLIRVQTRCKKRKDGAWTGYPEWPGKDRLTKRCYYDIDLDI